MTFSISSDARDYGTVDGGQPEIDELCRINRTRLIMVWPLLQGPPIAIKSGGLRCSRERLDMNGRARQGAGWGNWATGLRLCRRALIPFPLKQDIDGDNG